MIIELIEERDDRLGRKVWRYALAEHLGSGPCKLLLDSYTCWVRPTRRHKYSPQRGYRRVALNWYSPDIELSLFEVPEPDIKVVQAALLGTIHIQRWRT